ncbi:MAG: hypothetical protein H3C51_00295 [Rubellimicrobium sp.]|nr:hypothetical protein [Rubellimicrobium sp.]
MTDFAADIPPQPARLSDTGTGLVRHTGASWPRSGHHLLVRLLQGYFGDRFGYCQHYHTSAACCGCLPCTRPDIHLSKSHDFTADLPRDPARRYLVQWRDFLPSVISDFELAVRAGGEDSRTAFLSHASHRFGAWQAFRARWVDWGLAQGQIVLRYEDLLADPQAALARVIAAFAPGDTPDPARIARIVARVDGERIERGRVTRLAGAGVHAPRDMRAFRHYDAATFALLTRLRLSRAQVAAQAGTGVLDILRLQAGE